MKLSYFWNIDNTPQKFFRCRFFEDWNHEEWQLFYEYLVACSRQFLTTGLIPIEYEKNNDNYNAYFSNEVVLEEFERIFEAMKRKGRFKVSDFLIEYKINSFFRNDKFFHKFNTRKLVEAYIQKHEIEVKYEIKNRVWVFEEGESSTNIFETETTNMKKSSSQLAY